MAKQVTHAGRLPYGADQLSFLSGANADFIANIYAKYLENPQSVDDSWAAFFGELNEDSRAILEELQGASWRDDRITSQQKDEYDVLPDFAAEAATVAKAAKAIATSDSADSRQAVLDSLRAIMLIRAYRVRGHLAADLDPLGLAPKGKHPELEPATYGFTEADMDRPIFLDNVLGLEYARIRLKKPGSRSALQAPRTAPNSPPWARRRSMSA